MTDLNEPAVVMAIDDTPANLKLLEEMLSRHGYRVMLFPRGAMALKAAATNPPDLILLDIMMPEMDGFEVCRRLKEDDKLKNIPTLFISALDDIANKVKAFSCGGVDYVTKPFQEEEVIARVKTHLTISQQQSKIEIQNHQIQEDYNKLRELEELRENLVQMIVHDMRSPLMGILGYGEIILDELKELGANQLVTYTEEIVNTGIALRDMISTLLDISRMEANQMPLDRENSDLRYIASKAMESLGSLTQTCEIQCQPPKDFPSVYCDSKVTLRIISNLIANAIKFTGRQGVVSLLFETLDHSVKLTVSDTGPGIPLQYQKKIFEKFGQVATRKEGKKYSTGLGLTFCKLAIEAQGGQIGVISEEGKGSQFWFTLPAV